MHMALKVNRDINLQFEQVRVSGTYIISHLTWTPETDSKFEYDLLMLTLPETTFNGYLKFGPPRPSPTERERQIRKLDDNLENHDTKLRAHHDNTAESRSKIWDSQWLGTQAR